ncbi:MAG: hypothetical protein O2800_03400 [Planctomycetota bacterium]|nr:hypothetical protein [Planctomycetota bacterium]
MRDPNPHRPIPSSFIRNHAGVVLSTVPDSINRVVRLIEREPQTACSFRVELDHSVGSLPGARLEAPLMLAIHELVDEMQEYWTDSTPRSDRSIVVCARMDHGTLHLHVLGDAPGCDTEQSFDGPPTTAGLESCRSMVQSLGGRCSVRNVPFGRGLMVSMLIPEGHLAWQSDAVHDS